MTCKEHTNFRDLSFSGWLRENLPGSSIGFVVSDLDFILKNEQTRRLMLLEIKTNKKSMKPWQKRLFSELDAVLQRGESSAWHYDGFHLVQFENKDFKSGRCAFDGNIVSEDRLRELLSMST